MWGVEGDQGSKIVHQVEVGTLEYGRALRLGYFMVTAGGRFANRPYGMGAVWVRRLWHC